MISVLYGLVVGVLAVFLIGVIGMLAVLVVPELLKYLPRR